MTRKPRLIHSLIALTALAQVAAAQGTPRLLVLNKAADTLSIIDPSTRETVATIPTGHGPHEVLATKDGKLAVVTNYGDQTPGNSLSIIDLATHQEKQRVDLGPLLRPHGLVEADGKVYFTAEMNRAIGRIDPATGQVDRIVGLGQDGTHMIAASPDGRFLYTANIGSGSVSLVDRKTGELSHVAVGPEPEGIALSPDGTEIWASHRVEGLVTVIDSTTRQVKGTLRVGDVAIRVQITPDGRLALVTDPSTGELIVIDRAKREEIKRLTIGQAPVGILITPEGDRAYVALAAEDAVIEVDLKTLEVGEKIKVGQGPDGLSWAVVQPAAS